jgi:aminomethyltransferase
LASGRIRYAVREDANGYLVSDLIPVTRPAPGMITITSACHSVVAGGTLGLGFARRADVRAGVPLIDPHGTFADIRLALIPFFDPHKLRPRAAWTQLDHRP